MGEIEFASDDH